MNILPLYQKNKIAFECLERNYLMNKCISILLCLTIILSPITSFKSEAIPDNSFSLSSNVLTEANNRIEGYMPCIGSPKVVVFVIDFLPHSSTPEADMAPVPLSASSEILGGYRYWLIRNFRH